MAISHAKTQVKWPTNANTTSIAFGAPQNSEEVTLSTNAIARQLSVKVDNAGTPGAGDTATVYLLRTSGDPDADADVTDELDTDDHGLWLMQLDTNLDDPAIRTVDVPTAFEKCKVRIVNNSAADSYTCSAQFEEVTA